MPTAKSTKGNGASGTKPESAAKSTMPLRANDAIPNRTDAIPFSTQAALDFLRAHTAGWPAGWYVQVVAIEPAQHEGHKPVPEAMTVAVGKLDRLAAFIEVNQGKRNLYFAVNPLTRCIQKKAKEAHIAAVCYLHVDIDPEAGKPFAAERTRILGMLEGFTRRPSTIVNSGGGYQGFWKLGEPQIIDGNIEELKAWNDRLATALGADHCQSLDHVMRLPSTVNLPCWRKRDKGRVPAAAELVYQTGTTYSLSEFEFLPHEKVPLPDIGQGFSDSDIDPARVEPMLKSAAKDPELAKLLKGEKLPWMDGDSRSHFDWALALVLGRLGWGDADIGTALLMFEHGKASGRDKKYVTDILEKIRKKFADEKVQSRINELAKLNSLAYEAQRKQASKELGMRINVLDALVTATKKRLGLMEEDTRGGGVISFSDVDPWDEPVNGAELLDSLAGVFNKYAFLPEHGANILALWTVFSYCMDSAEHAPILAITSPVMRCGKSTVFQIVKALARRSISAVNITPAALFRLIEAHTPTLMLDELDALLETDGTGDIRALINAGHTRDSGVIRTVGEDFEVRSFSAWCAKAIALIGKLDKTWGTVADRSVIIEMERKPKEMRLPRIGKTKFETLKRQIVRWVEDAEIDDDPAIPEALDDRAADNWRILIGIADAAGGDWGASARAAAQAGIGKKSTGDDTAIRLLTDIRTIFGRIADDRISSEALAHALNNLDDDEAPWAKWNERRGRFDSGIDKLEIARILKPFKVKSGNIRFSGNKVTKGYYFKAFENSWKVYLDERKSLV